MPKRSLGELERSVMERLWAEPEDPEHPGLTVRQVHAALAAERGAKGIAYTTVMTVMDRLARKELVQQERDGRAYRYRARATRAALTAELMHDTLADFDAHDRRTALAAFVEDATAEDVAALRQALAQLEPLEQLDRG